MTASLRLLAGVLVLALLLIAGYFLFVQTAWGQSLDYRGYFGHAPIDRAVRDYDGNLLDLVSKRALIVLAATVLGLGFLQRKFLPALFSVGALGVAVVGAEWLKHHLPRPHLVAPLDPLPDYFAFDTYPSGHTTIGTSAALAVLFVLPSAVRVWLAPLGGLLSASYGTAVLFMGWHRPSDAVGGVLWSGLCFGLAAGVLTSFEKTAPPAKGAPRLALGISLLLAAGAIGALWLGATFPGATPPFLGMATAIVVAGFSVVGWFSSAYRRG